MSIKEVQANKDVCVYYQWLQDKAKEQEAYSYDINVNCNQYSVYDLMQIKYDTEGDFSIQMIELKGRYCKSTSFNDCGINYEKIQSLQRYSNMTGIPTFVVSLYYGDRKVCVWKIDTEKQYDYEVRLCKDTQQDSKGKVQKKIVPLLMSDAKKFTIPPHILLG